MVLTQEFRGLVVLFIGIASLSQGLAYGILFHWCNKMVVMFSW